MLNITRQSVGRHRALLWGSLAILSLLGGVPVALQAAAPDAAVPEGIDIAPATQVMTVTGSGGGKWMVVATATSIVAPPSSSPSPTALRVGVPTERDELPMGDVGMIAGDTDGQEGEG